MKTKTTKYIVLSYEEFQQILQQALADKIAEVSKETGNYPFRVGKVDQSFVRKEFDIELI